MLYHAVVASQLIQQCYISSLIHLACIGVVPPRLFKRQAAGCMNSQGGATPMCPMYAASLAQTAVPMGEHLLTCTCYYT